MALYLWAQQMVYKGPSSTAMEEGLVCPYLTHTQKSIPQFQLYYILKWKQKPSKTLRLLKENKSLYYLREGRIS